MLNKSEKNKLKIIELLPYLIVIELVLGGSGRLITFGSFFTLRYILFALAIIYYVIKLFSSNFKLEPNIFFVQVYLFFSIFGLAIINGVVKGYGLNNIISSSKGFLYLLMIFPFTLFMQDTIKAKKIIRVFNHSVVLLSILSIIIFFVFWLKPSTINFITDLLTKYDYGLLAMRSKLPAIFLKTSPYMAITLIYEIFGYINFKEQRKLHKATRIVILSLGCMTTMSMGIWLSVVIGIGCVLLLTKGRAKIITIIVLTIFTILLLTVFSSYIIPVIHNRFSTRDSSYIIKMDQLHTLFSVWKNNPIFGNGFGIEVSSHTKLDTRLIVNFELFWFQLLVNTGIIGFGIYIAMIVKAIHRGFRFFKLKNKEDSVHIKGMVVGLIVLCIISSSNPFLNNPIGLGYFVLVMCTINVYEKKGVKNVKI